MWWCALLFLITQCTWEIFFTDIRYLSSCLLNCSLYLNILCEVQHDYKQAWLKTQLGTTKTRYNLLFLNMCCMIPQRQIVFPKYLSMEIAVVIYSVVIYRGISIFLSFYFHISAFFHVPFWCDSPQSKSIVTSSNMSIGPQRISFGEYESRFPYFSF